MEGLTKDVVAEFGTDLTIAPASSACTPIEQSNTTKAKIVLQTDLCGEAARRAFSIGITGDASIGGGSVRPATVDGRQEGVDISKENREEN